ncbi:unnamed protein product [Callosobruchus maculatus]|uniref:Uncharacterized protein n=1 Tax=Callosobruchus maculatus TaxID=64391 RepID=A0A653CTL4_CALMS|nr:unnamed protein product [Callosobruchus maculatus]
MDNGHVNNGFGLMECHDDCSLVNPIEYWNTLLELVLIIYERSAVGDLKMLLIESLMKNCTIIPLVLFIKYRKSCTCIYTPLFIKQLAAFFVCI